LNGQKSNATADSIKTVDNALRYADKAAANKVKSIYNIFAIVFSLLLLTGIIVCAICDLAISGNFTWSLFPISSIIFAWPVLFPVMKFGKKGICGAMIAFSILIVPFLYVLNCLIETSGLILPIGIRMAVISVVFLWVVFALFKILKSRKLFASAISLLIAIPVCLLINFNLSQFISEPLIDDWDILTFFIVIIAASVLFIIAWRKRV